MTPLTPPRRAWLAAAALVTAGLVACAPDAQSTAAGTGEPVWPGEEWPVSTPEAEGLDPAAIDSLVADIDAGRFGLIDHLLLIRHGRVIADRHWDHGEEYARILAEQEDTVSHPTTTIIPTGTRTTATPGCTRSSPSPRA